MKLTIQNTNEIVEVNGIPARVWIGKSEGGQDVICLITRIAVPADRDCSDFERELKETPQPTQLQEAFPSRLIL